VRVRAAQDGGVEHAGQLDIRGVDRLAAGALTAVEPGSGLPDGSQRPLGPLVERVLLHHDPLLGVAALDFLLGTDQARQVAIASSILG
jgi:hypothetical protein